MQNINQFEDKLWEAADNLRANSKLTSSEYCMPVLGVIFLRHATNRYNTALQQIEEEQAAGEKPKRKLRMEDFLERRALLLPPESRYDEISKRKSDGKLGTALNTAMSAIEHDFPALRNQLPKEYTGFEESVLEDLVRIFNSETLRTASGDVFGRIYEYFLMKFAIQGAQDNGEFFTPPSLVQTIVNVIEPDHGIVFDPACGSGGMFVQSSHFIEDHGADTNDRVTFFGQEKTKTTIRLAKMNLAVHGLEGDIREANTFYEDVHRLTDGKPLFGNCDFVMANPPFNVDMVDAEKVKTDIRLPFGLPGVNKTKKVSNGNYLWISYFHSYLNAKGRAGFVMSSQASSAGHGEAEVRRKLIETGDVDVMISIRSNFFYTRSVPCELWHFDRNKSEANKDNVLMIDARNIYRKVTRKIYDFTPEQLHNLTAVVWLYRGQNERFTDLVKGYFKTLKGEVVDFAKFVSDLIKNTFDANLEVTRQQTDAYLALVKGASENVAQFLEEAQTEAKNAYEVYHKDRDALLAALEKFAQSHCESLPATNEQQHTARQSFEPLAERCKGLIKQVDLVYKLMARVVQVAGELKVEETVAEKWDRRAASKQIKQLDEARKITVEHLKRIAYFHRQIAWLQERFPEAQFVAVPGLCRMVTRAEIEAADWSLTPGRYVGVAAAEVDDDFDFEKTLSDIHIELADLNQEALTLAAKIQQNFEELGI